MQDKKTEASKTRNPGAKKQWEPPRITWLEVSAIRTALGQSAVGPGYFEGQGGMCDINPAGSNKSGPGEFDAGDSLCATS
jgi:hypothetical protein